MELTSAALLLLVMLALLLVLGTAPGWSALLAQWRDLRLGSAAPGPLAGADTPPAETDRPAMATAPRQRTHKRHTLVPHQARGR